MPTGYTAKIADGQNFNEFVWGCARAFGALILMRDERSDAPVPERFEPSDFHKQVLESAKADLASVQQMSIAEAQRRAQDEYDQRCGEVFVYTKKDQELADKYHRMIAQVEAWTPPTSEHQGLKDFMLQQLRESMRFDCGFKREPPVLQTGAEWKRERLEALNRSIARHTEEHAKEVERTEGRNRWLRELRAIVPQA